MCRGAQENEDRGVGAEIRGSDLRAAQNLFAVQPRQAQVAQGLPVDEPYHVVSLVPIRPLLAPPGVPGSQLPSFDLSIPSPSQYSLTSSSYSLSYLQTTAFLHGVVDPAATVSQGRK
jgi:hypothetical protein